MKCRGASQKKCSFTKEQLRKLIQEDNLPYTRIGEMFGVSYTIIRRKAKEMGVFVSRKRVLK